MDLEKVLLVVLSIALLAFIVREFFKKKIIVNSMIISKDDLLMLKNDLSFKTLFFSPFYQSSMIKRDEVLLDTHKISAVDSSRLEKNNLIQRSTEKGVAFQREINYSVYRLTKIDIEEIIMKYVPETMHYLLKAIPFKDAVHGDFFAYKFIPLDSDKRRFVQMENVQRDRDNTGTAQERTAFFDSSTGDDDAEELRETKFFIMKPSPPAGGTSLH